MGAPARRGAPMVWRMAALVATAAIAVGALGPSGAVAAGPAPTTAPTAKPPTGNPPTGASSDGAYVVPAGAAPIVLKNSGGPASGAASAPGRSEVALRASTAAGAPPSVKTELVNLRTEHTRTYQMPDSRYALEATQGRLNYPDAKGAWQPVDLSLKPSGDKTFGLQVAALDRSVQIGTGDAGAGIARLSSPTAGTITLTTSEAGAASNETTSPSTGTVSGVDFAGQVAGHPRVIVRPTDTGFEFLGFWDDAKANPTLDFTLDAGTLTPSLAADGHTILLSSTVAADGTSTPAGVISAPVILEGGDHGGPAFDQSIVGVTLTQGAGTTWTLSYTLDAKWLADPARVFPVVLDPSACIANGVSGCSGISADHFVISGTVNGQFTAGTAVPVGWNVVRVGYDNRGYGYDRERGLAYFESVTLPDGATVYDTDLQLHISSEYGTPSGDTITAYRINDTWTQSTSWNQFGTGGNGYTGTNSASATVPTSGYMHWDPDAIVQSWYAHRAQGWTQNLGFAFKLGTESSANGDVEFDRYNDATAAYRPKLTIYYEVPKAKLTFDPALGATYSPSTMLAGVATTLPVRIQNLSGFTFTSYASSTTNYYDLGYRFFDQKGNVPTACGASACSGAVHLPASIGNGTTSSTIALPITAPTTAGPYSLRLDLVRHSAGTAAYASDYADPSKYYERAKLSTASNDTRWVGKSAVERDEFSIRSVATTPAGGEWQTVRLGSGDSLAINLWSRDLEYQGSGGVGFSDLLPVGLDYGYRLSATSDATGILGANGWWTNFDERLVGGSGAGDFTYQDPSGNRTPINTNNDAQLLGASVRIDRPRVTVWDDNGAGGSGTLGDPMQASFASPTFAAFSGTYVLKASANGNQGITPTGFKAIDLNQYPMAKFAVRTTNVTAGGVGFKIHNVTNGGTYADRWFDYTVGGSYTSGYSQYPLGFQSGHTTLVNDWNFYADDNLLNRIVADGNFGSSTDDYQIIALDTFSATNGAGSIYVDALRFEGRGTGGISDANPPWTSRGTGTSTSTDTPDGSTTSVLIPSSPIASSPDCTGSPCFSTKNLIEFPYASWYWRKVGGGSAAVVFHLKNARTSATADITYYAGPTAPVGASHPIQVADSLPEGWVKVTRNLLEDGRAVLNWFNDTARETHSSDPVKVTASTRAMYNLVGATTGSPLGPDDVSATGYSVSGVDGTYVLVDALVLTTLPDLGADAATHPSAAGDATFTYDFAASYPDGTIHYFDDAGLLVRIADRNKLIAGNPLNAVNLDWQIAPNVAGQGAFTLKHIYAPSNGSGYARQIDVGSAGGVVTFTETLGASASPATGRSTAFTIAGGDVTAIKPARQPVACPASAAANSGCTYFAYDATTAHQLTYVSDPRWNGASGGATDYRYHVTYLGTSHDPEAIRNASQGDIPQLRVVNYAVSGSIAPASARVLWQDAAAARAGAGIYTDLTVDGTAIDEYAPLACTGGDCSTNPPSMANLANQIVTAHELDGGAHVSTEVAYRCPADASVITGCIGSTAERVVTRRVTRAAASVDNFSDPLVGAEVAWTQTPDEYASSLRDSGSTNPDLYRSVLTYDEFGRVTTTTSYAYNARPDYPATIKSTTQSGAALTAYWRLDETTGNVVDSSTHGYVGTATGLAYGTAGALVGDADKAVTLNGSSSRITSAAPIASSAYTLEAWVNVGQAGLSGKGIVGDWASSTGVLLYLNGSSAFGLVHNATYIQSTFVPTPGRWYDVVATWDGSTGKVFVDGAIVAQGAASGAPGAGASSLEIGSYGNGTSTTFLKGSLDEVAIWNQALTPSQIQNQWLAGRSVAQTATETTFDKAWHPTQVDDQYLASGGFESEFTDWDFGQGIGGSVCTAASGSCAVHTGQAAFSTGLTGNAQQDVVLVPGQTVRFQFYTQRTSSTINGTVAAYYWKRSTAAWTALALSWANSTPGTWQSLAWDFTLPLDTDGRVRISLWSGSGTGSDTVYYDDVALYTSWANATYNSNGTVDRNQVLRPGQAGGTPGAVVPTIDIAHGYAADTSTSGFTPHPAIWPTSVTANFVDGTFDPAKPDEDVKSTSTFDTWGRALVSTDPDGVAKTTTYSTAPSLSSTNGYLTDADTVTDGLGDKTSSTYDLVGSPLTVTDPLHRVTTNTYDLAGHLLTTTTPNPDNVTSASTYDAYGFKLTDVANQVDGNPSAGGIDDLVTRYTYDAFGNQTQVDADCATGASTGSCAGGTFIDAKTTSTYDLLGNVVASTVYPLAGGTGTPRTTTSYFETTAGPSSTTVTRPKPSATRGPIAPTATAPMAPPTCPDTTLMATLCTSAAVMLGAAATTVSGVDLDGQTLGTTDAYGKVTRTFHDVVGNTVFSVVNYADGVYDPAAPDTDLVTATVYDLAGKAIRTVDALGRATNTTRDSLEQATTVANLDSTGSTISVAKTVFTPGGRVDRTSLPDASSAADSARTWKKTIFDLAGRAIKTIDHYDITGSAGLATDAFEGPSLTDPSITGDRSSELWSTAAGVFIVGGATATENHAAANAVRGTSTLDVAPTAAGQGVEWKLDGTFRSGHAYKATIWVNAPSGTTVRVRFGTASDPATAATSDVVGTGGWQRLAAQISWTPTADRTGAVLAAYDSTGTGAFRLDDAVVWDNATPDLNVTSSETAYDATGQIIASVVPPGVPGTDEPMVTTTARDVLGRPTTVTVNAVAGAGTGDNVSNLSTTTVYDALGRTISSTDPRAIVTQYAYDRRGNVTTTIQNYVDGVASGQYADDDVTSTFAYDAAGELVGYCPADQVWAGGCDPASSSNMKAWHYGFDDAAHLTVQTPPANVTAAALASTRWEYDAGGRLALSCDTSAPASTCTAGGASVVRTMATTYDGAGRTTQVDTYAGAKATLALRTLTTFNGDGTPAKVQYYEGSAPSLKDAIDYGYDNDGRLLTTSRSGTVISAQTWNADGTLATRTDGDQTGGTQIGTSTYGYDWAKRLTSVVLPGAFATATATFAWRADGLVAGRTWSGTSATFGYDQVKRPTSLTKGSISETQAYDRDGNVTSEARSFPNVAATDAGSGTQSFLYDKLNRVTASSGLATAHTYSYTYDRDGNRATRVDGGVNFTYAYDRTDELVSVLKAGQSTQSFTYDARGNLTGDAETGLAVTGYAYDLGNKLTAIDAAGTANDAAFIFDAFGRIRTRAVNGVTDTYSYAGTGSTVARIATGGVNLDSIVSPSGERIAAKSGADRQLVPARPPREHRRLLERGRGDGDQCHPVRPVGRHHGHGIGRRHRCRRVDLEVPGTAGHLARRAEHSALRDGCSTLRPGDRSLHQP